MPSGSLALTEAVILCAPDWQSTNLRAQVLISDLALVVVGGGLWRAGQNFGWGWLACVYGIPYVMVNHWLVSA